MIGILAKSEELVAVVAALMVVLAMVLVVVVVVVMLVVAIEAAAAPWWGVTSARAAALEVMELKLLALAASDIVTSCGSDDWAVHAGRSTAGWSDITGPDRQRD